MIPLIDPKTKREISFFDLMQRLYERAGEDDAFRQELIDNPRKVVDRELAAYTKFFLHPDVRVEIHEDAPDAIHLILPRKAHLGGIEGELSDAELEAVAAGCYPQYCHDVTGIQCTNTGS